MFMDTPTTLVFVAGGAFLLGWILAKIGSALGNKIRDRKRDPRDDRIRNLDAELRIAQSERDKAREELEVRKKEVTEEKARAERRDTVIAEQQQTIAKLKSDLRDSVLKTRELRNELQERATESVRSEVKLREVETELSIAQASTDLIATGVLDYSVAPDAEEGQAKRSAKAKSAN